MQTLRRVSRWIDATADSLKQSSVVFSDVGDCFGLGQRRPLGVADDLVAPTSAIWKIIITLATLALTWLMYQSLIEAMKMFKEMEKMMQGI